jgi:hypothetical protein
LAATQYNVSQILPDFRDFCSVSALLATGILTASQPSQQQQNVQRRRTGIIAMPDRDHRQDWV